MKLEKFKESIQISVSDTGPGIPQELSEKLFEKFYRIPAKNESQRQGFGIGLFLAKKFVEIHKGSILFKSRDKEGTVFYINLPDVGSSDYQVSKEAPANEPANGLVNDLYPDISDYASTSSSNVAVPVDGGVEDIISAKQTVLIIDDDTELRHYIKQLLVNNYHVYEADNAEAGFEKIVEIEPDIIVCDVVMGGMSGVDLCIKLKETQNLNHIPLILLTSSSSPDVKLKGIECGADDYITKPFESDLLIARIKGILKGRETLKTYFLNEITLKNNSIKVPEEYRLFLSKCIEIVERHFDDEDFNVKVFAGEIGMSHSNLFKKIKSISGLSINEFIRFIRLRKAAELMIKTDLQVKEIAYRVGFQQVRYFREQFFKVFEVNPSEFIAKYRNTLTGHHKLNDKFQQFNK